MKIIVKNKSKIVEEDGQYYTEGGYDEESFSYDCIEKKCLKKINKDEIGKNKDGVRAVIEHLEAANPHLMSKSVQKRMSRLREDYQVRPLVGSTGRIS